MQGIELQMRLWQAIMPSLADQPGWQARRTTWDHNSSNVVRHSRLVPKQLPAAQQMLRITLPEGHKLDSWDLQALGMRETSSVQSDFDISPDLNQQPLETINVHTNKLRDDGLVLIHRRLTRPECANIYNIRRKTTKESIDIDHGIDVENCAGKYKQADTQTQQQSRSLDTSTKETSI